MFLGIIATTLIGIPMGLTHAPASLTENAITLAPTLFKFDFGGLFSHGVLPVVTAIITFAMCDCFDTVGTLIGTASNAGMLDKDGNLPHGDKALVADACATVVGACLGTSTVTTFVESSAGIAEGGRTGLSSVFTAAMFFIAMFLAPIASLVPSCATAASLVYVGILMIGGVKEIEWSDPTAALPAFMTMACMPFTYNISYGIAFGLITYIFVKIFTGKIKEINIGTWIIGVLFAAMFFVAR